MRRPQFGNFPNMIIRGRYNAYHDLGITILVDLEYFYDKKRGIMKRNICEKKNAFVMYFNFIVKSNLFVDFL